MEQLRALLRRFKQVGMRACHSQRASSVVTQCLNHIVSADGMRLEAAGVAAIQNLPSPRNADWVRSFLGVIGLYRCYVQGHSIISKPLTARECTGQKGCALCAVR
jgi:hypothetical protein